MVLIFINTCVNCSCQVAPAELESVLLSHPLIVDAAVIPYVTLGAFSILFSFSP
jgi:acyl-coenzyme A synthetase/AMP-(fatty) acid ligase